MRIRMAVGLSLLSAAALAAGPAGGRPEPLPEKVVAAWRKAGATPGWVGKSFGLLEFRRAAEEGDVPAFLLEGRPAVGWGALPAVGRPFGLSLAGGAGDADLRGIAAPDRLHSLDLVATRVTAAGLKELAALKQLRMLDLSDTKVTDAGLKRLAGLKQLRGLSLGGTRVTDAGLKELARLKQLQTLSLAQTQVTDAGLKELAGLKQLRDLALGGTRVTDTGLKELAALTQLQSLYLFRTKVTERGVEELRKALPGCDIVR